MKRKLIIIFSLVLILSFITIFSIHRVFHNNPNSIFLPIEDEACSDLAKAKKSENEAVEFDSFYLKSKKVGFFTDIRKKQLYVGYKYKDSFVKNNYDDYFEFLVVDSKHVKLTKVLGNPTGSCLIIPSYAYVNNKKYIVNEIGKLALLDYKSVFLPKSIENLNDGFSTLKSDEIIRIYGGENLKEIGKVNCSIDMFFNKKIESINLSNVLISNDTFYIGKNTKVFYDDECYINSYHKYKNELIVKVNKNNKYIKEENGVILSKDSSYAIYLNNPDSKYLIKNNEYVANYKKYIISDSVKYISNTLFKGKSAMEIIINCDIDEIDESLFYDVCANKIVFNGRVGKICSNGLTRDKLRTRYAYFKNVGIIEENAISATIDNLIIDSADEINEKGIKLVSFYLDEYNKNRYIAIPNFYLDVDYVNSVEENEKIEKPIYILLKTSKVERDATYKDLNDDRKYYVFYYDDDKNVYSWHFDNENFPRLWNEES